MNENTAFAFFGIMFMVLFFGSLVASDYFDHQEKMARCQEIKE